MNETKIKKLEELNIDDFIWYIYIFIVVSALYSNYLEKEYVKTNDIKNASEFHTINIIVLTIAFFIYIYFVFKAYEKYQKKESYKTTIALIGALLFLVGGALFLLVEIQNINDEINEIAV